MYDCKLEEDWLVLDTRRTACCIYIRKQMISLLDALLIQQVCVLRLCLLLACIACYPTNNLPPMDIKFFSLHSGG